MRSLGAITTILLAATTLAGCLSEESGEALPVEETETEAETVIPESVTAFGDILPFELPGSGQGIWIHDDLLYHTNGGDLHILDVSDPAMPVELASLDGIGARDVDVLEWNNHTYAALAASSDGMHIVDVTTPAAAELVTTVDLPSAGVHNLAALPGTPYIYSSGASGPNRAIDVLDITDMDNPVVHTFDIPARLSGMEIESDGCHDITVRPDLGRAYCAGGGGKYVGRGGESFIWDISEDPTDPVWVSAMDDPRIKYHHQAFANADGTILIIDDEFIAPNCERIDTPLPGAYDPQVPTAAAWIWDISDETNPVLRSLVQNPATTNGETMPNPEVSGVISSIINCGSHFGDLIPGHEAFVMGWYEGGTMLVNFDDPDNPQILDVLGAEGSTWDSRYHNGHIFHASGDLLVTPLV